jgi:hypothetical protein
MTVGTDIWDRKHFVVGAKTSVGEQQQEKLDNIPKNLMEFRV